MSPNAQFNAIVATATVAIMYGTIIGLAPRLTNLGGIAVTAAGALSAFGVYRLLSIFVRYFMGKSEMLKKAILGSTYVHGTWVGAFRGRGGDTRLMVEHFEQDLEHIVIKGRSYTDQQATHAFWTSKMVSLDPQLGQLMFTYDIHIASRDESISGIHTSIFQRATPDKAPTALAGLAQDLSDQNRVVVQSFKVCDDLLDWEGALKRAEQLVKDRPDLVTVAVSGGRANDVRS